MILDAVRESGGAALTAEESRLTDWMQLAMRSEGIALCPEAAACLGVLDGLLRSGTVTADETVVVFNTGAAQKYVEVIDVELRQVSAPVDYGAL